jgi:hypothetical protein
LRAARSLFRRQDDEVGPEKSEATGDLQPAAEVAGAAEDASIDELPAQAAESLSSEAAAALQRQPDTTPVARPPAAAETPDMTRPQEAESAPFETVDDVEQWPPSPERQIARLATTEDKAAAQPIESSPDEPVERPPAIEPAQTAGPAADVTLSDMPAAEPTKAQRPAQPAAQTQRPGEPAPAQPPPAAPAEATRTAAEVQAKTDERPPAVDSRPIESGPEAIDDDQETIIAPLPLQSVWPVKEQPAPAQRPPSPEPQPKPVAQRKSTGGEVVGDEVHAALSDVLPGKYTDSSIELVTPRRPRPVTQPPPLSRQPQMEEETDDQEPARPPEAKLPPVQKAPAEPASSGAASGETVQGETAPPVQAKPTDEPSPAAAPKAEPPPEGQQGSGPRMVQTEVGELPSDLWKLLGEEPPSPRPSPPAAPAPPAPAPAGPALAEMPATAVTAAAVAAPTHVVAPQAPVVRRALDTMTTAPGMGRLVTQAFAPPVIQRVEEQVRSPGLRESGETDESDSDAEQEEASDEEAKVDVDKLAALVFPEIKRRLAIEWERGRSRIR